MWPPVRPAPGVPPDGPVGALGPAGGDPLEEHMSKPWPEPTTPEPDESELEEWSLDGVADATDGCSVEPDGECPHGHPSWILRLGLI